MGSRFASTLAYCSAAARHCGLVKSGVGLDTCSWNKILMSYAKFSGILDAWNLFDEIPQRDTVSWNSLIGAYVLKKRFEDVWILFVMMLRKELAFDEYTLGSVFKSVAGVGRVEFGLQVHCLLVKSGLHSNVFAGSALVDMYAKCGKMTHASHAFDLMPICNTVSWNALISGFAQVGDVSTVFQLFDQMEREDVRPDEATFASILTLMDKPGFGKMLTQIHAKILTGGWETDTIVHNAAITAYSLCGSVLDSRKLFDSMVESKDLVTWNSMLAAYAHHGWKEQAFNVYMQMLTLGLDPDMYTFTSLISACVDYEQALHGRILHALASKKGLETAVPVSNALITMYARSDNACNMDSALQCFDLMESKDTISWNSILTAFSQNGSSEEAIKFFVYMLHSHSGVDHYALSAALRSCSDLAVLQLGRLVHCLGVKSGFIANDFVSSSLIYMYSKCGAISDARKSFDESHKDSTVSWNSVIFGYAQHGQGQSALDLFNEMLHMGVKPDHITCVAILTACSHTGLIDVGSMFLKSITPVYGIPLRMEHYACGVDLFGRAGRLDEAMELIRSMPFEPDAMVWMTLLGACRIHGDMELASFVARQLLVVESTEYSIYVLFSSLLSGFRMWDDRATIQKVMKNRGLKKVPGWSWIEVNNKVHSFNAEDRSHSDATEIYTMLEIFVDGEWMKDQICFLEHETDSVEIG